MQECTAGTSAIVHIHRRRSAFLDHQEAEDEKANGEAGKKGQRQPKASARNPPAAGPTSGPNCIIAATEP